jgi:hypothetical protein
MSAVPVAANASERFQWTPELEENRVAFFAALEESFAAFLAREAARAAAREAARERKQRE